MNTVIVNASENKINEKDIEKAAEIIINGGTCVFPTETVYGLGACAYNKDAINKIFKAKNRPGDNPLIVHVSGENMILELYNYIEYSDKRFEKLKEAFWPGALTIIVPKSYKIPYEATAGLDTMAMRCPSGEIATKIIRKAKVPICAPSANLSGKPSGTNSVDVKEDLTGRVDMIILNDAKAIGLESTVIDITKESPVILRPGYITKEEIESILKEDVLLKNRVDTNNVPESPGMKYRHYAPNAPMTVYLGAKENIVREILKDANDFNIPKKEIGILSFGENIKYDKYFHICLTKEGNEVEAAKEIYASLRKFDRNNVKYILAESIEEKKIGLAIMNRLFKACGNKIKNV